MAAIRRKTERRLTRMCEIAIGDLLKETLDHTPVITGRLMASFRFGAGTPSLEQADPIVPYPSLEDDLESIASYRHKEPEMVALAQTAIRETRYPVRSQPIGYLTNMLYYAWENEAGIGMGQRHDRPHERAWDYGPQPKEDMVEDAGRKWPRFASTAIQRAISEEN
jgi:hypothetical protein